MESERERVKKVELIQKSINQLIKHEQHQSKTCHLLDESFVAVDDNDDDETDHRHQLLSQLITQLDSLKEESRFDQMNESTNLQEATVEIQSEEDKVVKELRKIQKQNFITQCLLSAMIVLTLTWQLSEVSIILKMKDGLNHPFRSITSMLTGWIKRPPPLLNAPRDDLNNSAKQQVEAMSLPKLKVPELPHMELPSLDFINEQD